MHTLSPNIKKGFKTHVKQKKRRKDPQPTKLDFQNSNHLHKIWGTMQQLTISYMLAKSFAQKVYSIFRKMKINCLILA